MVKTISTVAELVSEYRRHNPNGHFFDPSTLAFFGEKISKMQYMGLTVIPDVYERNRRCYKICQKRMIPFSVLDGNCITLMR